LAVGEIRPRLHDIFDYARKYQSGGADEVFPADLPAETSVSFARSPSRLIVR